MSFIIAAPASGSGKTTITLGLLRALTNRGQKIRGAKSGPDYIDPQFLAAACRETCCNLDAWAMTPDRIKAMAASDMPLIIEGAMGLFDGAPPHGKGATADLARILGLPVVLVVDAARMAQSIVPLVNGFAHHDPDVKVAGVILNRVGSPRHQQILRAALAPYGIPVLGAVPRTDMLAHPSRHLGLVQAQERDDLEAYLDQAASFVTTHVDFDALPDLRPLTKTRDPRRAPPAQNIAIAHDAAFAFAYPHMIHDWQQSGATIRLFSPLNNDSVPEADFVFLPGGYPELHAGHLAAQSRFLETLRKHRGHIYGECGGYMLLGDALTDADGQIHRMAGLLSLTTSFANRKLHLGYRTLRAKSGVHAGNWNGHEFHYATTVSRKGDALFQATDAEGTDLPDMGIVQGHVSGSFAHLIDRAP